MSFHFDFFSFLLLSSCELPSLPYLLYRYLMSHFLSTFTHYFHFCMKLYRLISLRYIFIREFYHQFDKSTKDMFELFFTWKLIYRSEKKNQYFNLSIHAILLKLEWWTNKNTFWNLLKFKYKLKILVMFLLVHFI